MEEDACKKYEGLIIAEFHQMTQDEFQNAIDDTSDYIKGFRPEAKAIILKCILQEQYNKENKALTNT